MQYLITGWYDIELPFRLSLWETPLNASAQAGATPVGTEPDGGRTNWWTTTEVEGGMSGATFSRDREGLSLEAACRLACM